MTPDLFTQDTGRDLRERGIEAITRSHKAPFMREGFRLIFEIGKSKAHFTADDVRTQLAEEFQPRSPQAWGALFVQAAKVGLIRRTGRYVPSLIPGNRARRNEIWASAIYRAA
jgi:hypothetical protein